MLFLGLRNYKNGTFTKKLSKSCCNTYSQIFTSSYLQLFETGSFKPTTFEGRPGSINTTEVEKAASQEIEVNPSISTRKIDSTLNITYKTVRVFSNDLLLYLYHLQTVQAFPSRTNFSKSFLISIFTDKSTFFRNGIQNLKMWFMHDAVSKKELKYKIGIYCNWIRYEYIRKSGTIRQHFNDRYLCFWPIFLLLVYGWFNLKQLLQFIYQWYLFEYKILNIPLSGIKCNTLYWK